MKRSVMSPVDRVVSVCGICQSERWQHEEFKHLPIYVNGSDGIVVCPDCDVALANHVSAMRSMACRAKVQQIAKCKSEH